MKKLFLITLLSGFLLPTFAQWKVPVITDSVSFTASTTSSTITLGRNEFLGQIWLDAGESLSVWVQFYDSSKEQWSWVDDGGTKLVYTTADSTLDWVIPLSPTKLYVGKTIRFIITGSRTFSMRYDKRPY